MSASSRMTWGEIFRLMPLRKLLCKMFGHFFDDISVIVFQIKTNELNGDMSATLTCKCCKQMFVHKDSPLADNSGKTKSLQHGAVL